MSCKTYDFLKQSIGKRLPHVPIRRSLFAFAAPKVNQKISYLTYGFHAFSVNLETFTNVLFYVLLIRTQTKAVAKVSKFTEIPDIYNLSKVFLIYLFGPRGRLGTPGVVRVVNFYELIA